MADLANYSRVLMLEPYCCSSLLPRRFAA